MSTFFTLYFITGVILITLAYILLVSVGAKISIAGYAIDVLFWPLVILLFFVPLFLRK